MSGYVTNVNRVNVSPGPPRRLQLRDRRTDGTLLRLHGLLTRCLFALCCAVTV